MFWGKHAGRKIPVNNVPAGILAVSFVLFILVLQWPQVFAEMASLPDTSGYDVRYLRLKIKASDTSTYLEGNVAYQLQVTAADRKVVSFELISAYTIDSVKVNGILVNPFFVNGILAVPVHDLKVDSIISVQIIYHGKSDPSGFFSGIESKTDMNWMVPVTWTLSEPYAANNWFPVKQYLPDKIDSADLFIQVPPGRKAGSNGILMDVDTLNDRSLIFHWKSRYPIDYYLLSFTVSDYQDYTIYAHPEGMIDSLPVVNYIYNVPGLLDSYKKNIDLTVSFIELYSRLFGPYPFPKEKYGHCLAPIGGGMEHQTMTTLNTFNFTLVSHELSHMWFGDMVTCASWNDIWLNEGFASYGEYLALQNLSSQQSADEWMLRAQQSAMSNLGGSVYVPDNMLGSESRIFSSALSYKKGAALIHMIRYEIGNDSLFFRVLHQYLNRFAYGTAHTEDFRQVLEQVTGKNFDNFFNQWCFGEGYPMLDITWTQQYGKLKLSFSETTSSPVTNLFKFPLQLKLVFGSSDTLVNVPVEQNTFSLEIPCSKRVKKVLPDPDNWLLKKASVYQVEASNKLVDVYPNPVGGKLTLEFLPDGKTRSLYICNTAGVKVFSDSVTSDSRILDVSGWARGIYILHIDDGVSTGSVRIVKY